jgi:hypothetical protein
MFSQVVEAIWECPYCSSKGKKWIKQREARKIAREHITKNHKKQKESNYKAIIIHKRKCEAKRKRYCTSNSAGRR